MSDYLTQADPDYLSNQVTQMRGEIDELKKAVLELVSAAGVTPDLGDMRAGRFIAASGEGGEPTDPDFSGVFMAATPETFPEGDFNIGGVNAGALQFGLKAVDGAAMAGAGAVRLDKDGMVIASGTFDSNAIKFKTGATLDAKIYSASDILYLIAGDGSKNTNSMQMLVNFIDHLLALELSSSNVLILTATGAYKARLQVQGGAVINEDGADSDTRVEGDTDANLLFVDASTDRVGIGTATPTQKLDVNGIAQINQLVVNDAGADLDTRIEGDTNVNLLYTDASTDRVGIGTATPAQLLDVAGVAQINRLIVNDAGADLDTRIEGDTDANLLYTDASTDRVGIGTATPSEKLDVLGNLFMNNGSVRSFTASLSDDTSTSFTPGKSNGAILVFTSTTNDYVMAFFNTAGPSCVAGPISANSAVATVALAGTTGTDTKLTVSAFTDGKIYIENRRGSGRSVYVLII